MLRVEHSSVWDEARGYLTEYLVRRFPGVPREEIARKVDAKLTGNRGLPCPIVFAVLKHDAHA
jgi:hypothetical protein